MRKLVLVVVVLLCLSSSLFVQAKNDLVMVNNVKYASKVYLDFSDANELSLFDIQNDGGGTMISNGVLYADAQMYFKLPLKAPLIYVVSMKLPYGKDDDIGPALKGVGANTWVAVSVKNYAYTGDNCLSLRVLSQPRKSRSVDFSSTPNEYLNFYPLVMKYSGSEVCATAVDETRCISYGVFDYVYVGFDTTWDIETKDTTLYDYMIVFSPQYTMVL